ncbi:MAG: hypothetical protein RMK19_07375 [Bacteroidia bacterium]|nr:hypothetical protein [Bacteroidia bacterium]MDW8015815.1 hypothetical protein [Bacteroidia bacterium]
MNPLWILTPSEIERRAVERILPYPPLVTGIGALATLNTLWRLYSQSQARPIALIVLGIAGSYTRSYPLLSVVYVQREIWGDLGRRGRFFHPTPPALRGDQPVEWVAPISPLSMPSVIGLTLHTVSASLREARYWRRAYPHAHIETQEGAAYFLFGAALQIPVYAFRVLSNYAGHRHWQKEAALDALATFTETHVVPLCKWILDTHSCPYTRRAFRGWAI